MERLTKKISKAVQDKYSLGSYLQYDFAQADDVNKLLNKLGKFEDFMEEQGFESLEELKKYFEVWNIEDDNGFLKDTDNRKLFLYRFAKNLFRYEKDENQALKDRWEAFKKWIADTKALRGTATYFLQETLLEKMQELEKEIK